MKKEFGTELKAFIAVIVLLPTAFLGAKMKNVYAISEKWASEEWALEKAGEMMLISGKRVTKTFSLDSEVVTQIPKYIVEEGVSYVLDESSIVVEETGRSASEGADVITTLKQVESLPDNDLERIDKEITYNGTPCELLYVVYEVTKEDEDGIPTEYSAACTYGGLEKYSSSYPSAWQAVVWYDAYELIEELEIVTDREVWEYEDTPKEKMIKMVKKENEMETEEEIPKSEKKIFTLKKIVPGKEEEERKKIPDMLIPLVTAAAATLGIGLLFPFILWFAILTVPIFALKRGEKYRYIGQIRLKKEETAYIACLTERLIDKAELPVFRIKMPDKIRKKMQSGILQVRCPDGKRIEAVCGKEVQFALERGESIYEE